MLWIDLNGDGDWADAGEWIFNDLPVSPGVNSIGFLFPAGATPGPTYARFRFTSQPFSSLPGLNEGGAAPDGEVEDYQIHDRGSRGSRLGRRSRWTVSHPDPQQWRAACHRARLCSSAPSIDGEPDGQPTAAADGDDVNPLSGPDDEDGVSFYPLIIGQRSAIDVSVAGSGMIDAWIDFNGNGILARPRRADRGFRSR